MRYLIQKCLGCTFLWPMSPVFYINYFVVSVAHIFPNSHSLRISISKKSVQTCDGALIHVDTWKQYRAELRQLQLQSKHRAFQYKHSSLVARLRLSNELPLWFGLSVPCEEIAHICIKRLKMFRLGFVDRGCWCFLGLSWVYGLWWLVRTSNLLNGDLTVASRKNMKPIQW